MFHSQEHVQKYFRSYITSTSISGLTWGVLESILLLSGQDVGEYDALFWGAFTYTVIGCFIGCLLTLLHLLLRFRFEIDWGLVFSIVLSLALSLYGTSVLFICVFFILSWYVVTVLINKTPLRMLKEWRGSLGVVVSMLLILGAFSLTPAKQVGRLSSKISVAPNQNISQNNIIVFLIEDLRRDKLDKKQNLGVMLSPKIVFTQSRIQGSVSQLLSALMQSSNNLISHDRHQQSLVDAGFQTVAIVNDHSLSHFSGLQQNFHHYVYLPSETPFSMQEGTRKLMIYRWFLDGWKQQQRNSKAFYRPASEILFAFRQYLQQNKETPFVAFIHLRDCQNLLSSELHNFDYHQKLDKLDVDLGHFFMWYQQQNGFEDTVVWVVGLQHQEREQKYLSEKNHMYTPLFLFHPNLQANIFDQEIHMQDLVDMIGKESQFFESETIFIPDPLHPTSNVPFPSQSTPHLQTVSSPKPTSVPR